MRRRPDDRRRAARVNSIARPATGPKAGRMCNARKAAAIPPARKADPSADLVLTALPKAGRNSADNAPTVLPEIPAVPIKADRVSCRRSSPRSTRTVTVKFPPKKSQMPQRR